MFKNAVALPFRLLGIPVKLDTSFLLILPLIAWLIGSQIPAYAALLRQVGLTVDTSALQQGLTPYVLGLSAAIGLFTSVVIHELGHAVAARLYGVETREITLWFLGGVAQFDEMPRQRGAEAVVAIAGPLTSVALAGLLWWAWNTLTLPGAVLLVLFYLSIMNGFLAVFNLLPALPLDGGRVLRSLLALRMDHVRATRLAAGISQVLAVVLGVFGLLRFQIFTVVLAFFIYNAARAERHYAVLSRTFEDLRVRDLMTHEVITVEPEMPLRQFVQLGHFKRFVGYPVVDTAGALVGFAKLKDAQERLEQDESATVREVMREAQTIPAAEEAMAALQRIAESDTGRLVVVDETGRMVGLLSKTDLIGHLQAAQGQRTRGPEAEPR